ncbi:extracellular solute-binding protein [Nonomuraea antimicrobica]
MRWRRVAGSVRSQGTRGPLQGPTDLAASGEDAHRREEAVRGRPPRRHDQAGPGAGRERGVLHQTRTAQPITRLGARPLLPRHVPGQRGRRGGQAGPLDDYLAKWPDWATQFPDSVKQAARGADGKIYGVPISTDTRGLWYQKDVFAKAGLPVPWEPKTWNDVLTAARTIKQKVPDAIPFSMYSTKALGEASTMQGFEMLLYGTPGGTLYDAAQQKWVAGGKNFTDALTFIDTIYREELGPRQADAHNLKLADKANYEWFPNARLGISLDGAWTAAAWKPTSTKPWPQWTEKIGWTAMPTQNGEEPGAVSMSGGWVMAMSAYTEHKQEAFDFLTVATNKENSTTYAVGTGDLAPARTLRPTRGTPPTTRASSSSPTWPR